MEVTLNLPPPPRDCAITLPPLSEKKMNTVVSSSPSSFTLATSLPTLSSRLLIMPAYTKLSCGAPGFLLPSKYSAYSSFDSQGP